MVYLAGRMGREFFTVAHAGAACLRMLSSNRCCRRGAADPGRPHPSRQVQTFNPPDVPGGPGGSGMFNGPDYAVVEQMLSSRRQDAGIGAAGYGVAHPSPQVHLIYPCEGGASAQRDRRASGGPWTVLCAPSVPAGTWLMYRSGSSGRAREQWPPWVTSVPGVSQGAVGPGGARATREQWANQGEPG